MIFFFFSDQDRINTSEIGCNKTHNKTQITLKTWNMLLIMTEYSSVENIGWLININPTWIIMYKNKQTNSQAGDIMYNIYRIYTEHLCGEKPQNISTSFLLLKHTHPDTYTRTHTSWTVCATQPWSVRHRPPAWNTLLPGSTCLPSNEAVLSAAASFKSFNLLPAFPHDEPFYW